MMKYLLIYLVAMNVITFAVYGIDKMKAKRGWWRIPETTLLGLAVIGSSLGAWAAMYSFRHKTQHQIQIRCTRHHHSANRGGMLFYFK